MHMKYNCKDFSSILSLSLFLSLIQHLSLKFLMRLGKKKRKKETSEMSLVQLDDLY